MKRLLIRFLCVALLLAAGEPVVVFAEKNEAPKAVPPSSTCLLGVRIVIHSSIDTALVERFSSSLFAALRQKFANINLCVDTCPSGCIKTDHGGVWLDVTYEPETESTVYSGSIVVLFKKNIGNTRAQHEDNQVLTLFQVPSGIDRGGLYMVVAEKIVENVRREVLGEVKVTTVPQGAMFTIDTTLRGGHRAPKTLLLPPGNYVLNVWMPKYLPYKGPLKVIAPGVNEVSVTLTKRRFYHSRYMPVFSFLAIATTAAFGCEYYFFDRYSRLGEQDYHTRPAEFQRLFDRARRCESTGFALLGLTAATFSLTFFF